MPRVASRINLLIKDIRVERLQDITEEDAIAEGLEYYESEGKRYFTNYVDEPNFLGAVNSYHSLWEKINGKDSWESNPWVWVIDFERIK